jgi:hypothetical protein
MYKLFGGPAGGQDIIPGRFNITGQHFRKRAVDN